MKIKIIKRQDSSQNLAFVGIAFDKAYCVNILIVHISF